jgi:hypothetical protein
MNCLLQKDIQTKLSHFDLSKGRASKLQRCFRDAALANLCGWCHPRGYILAGKLIYADTVCLQRVSVFVCVSSDDASFRSAHTSRCGCASGESTFCILRQIEFHAAAAKNEFPALLCALLLHNYSACVRCAFYITLLLLFSCIALVVRI